MKASGHLIKIPLLTECQGYLSHRVLDVVQKKLSISVTSSVLYNNQIRQCWEGIFSFYRQNMKLREVKRLVNGQTDGAMTE